MTRFLCPRRFSDYNLKCRISAQLPTNTLWFRTSVYSLEKNTPAWTHVKSSRWINDKLKLVQWIRESESKELLFLPCYCNILLHFILLWCTEVLSLRTTENSMITLLREKRDFLIPPCLGVRIDKTTKGETKTQNVRDSVFRDSWHF